MSQDILHEKICEKLDEVKDWFKKQKQDLAFSFYSSYDIRDSGLKIAPVDANIFPAGFNNICDVDKEAAPAIVNKYLEEHYSNSKKVLLVTEEHTNNAYYWENINTLKNLIEGSGREVFLTFANKIDSEINVESISGAQMTVKPVKVENEKVYVDDTKMEIIICNNDFSNVQETWIENVKLPMNPPYQLGWYNRKKSHFFDIYNNLVGEFSELLGTEPEWLKIQTQVFPNFDITSQENRESLAKEVDAFIASLKDKYLAMGIQEEPFVFVKNNAGTYGLAVLKVKSGEDVLSWNNKTRTKMKAAKGGTGVTEVIIQEGISTKYVKADHVAEPAIYLVGCQLVGGFLRSHSKKGADESLNSPGAIYRRLCVSDLKINSHGCPMENVYGWLAKIGCLAIAKEAKESNISFTDYKN